MEEEEGEEERRRRQLIIFDDLPRCLQSTLAPDKNRCSGLILFPEIDVYTSSKPLELKEFVGPFKRN